MISQRLNLPSTMNPILRGKAETMFERLVSYGKVVVAFSGGVDSTIVAYIAKIALGQNAVAVTADSPSLPSRELEAAQSLAAELGIKHLVVRTEELDDPNYTSNPSNRCYFCKKELSGKLRILADELNADAIVDGTNADDLKGHRPGSDALLEAGVIRPLADAGVTKDEVRELARIFGLPNSEKPSAPCLSSRVEYGQLITPKRLDRIERSENLIRELTGARNLRVRDHGNLARIEIGRDERELLFDSDLLDKIWLGLRSFGFTYVTVDAFGYRTGSMNERVPSRTVAPFAIHKSAVDKKSTAVGDGKKN